MRHRVVAAGFRIKSGWASAVVLHAQVAEPRVHSQSIVLLSDPEMPETRQPYHSARGQLERAESVIGHRTQLVLRSARRSVEAFMDQLAAAGLGLRRAGIVVGSMKDPEKITNPHIRAHAMEGRLFWKTLQGELARHSVETRVFAERDIFARGESVLGVEGPEELKAALTEIGQGITPWRSEQKLAALAAWIEWAEMLGVPRFRSATSIRMPMNEQEPGDAVGVVRRGGQHGSGA